MHHEPETPPVLDQSFPTDPTGLPEAAAPQILGLADGDTLNLHVAPVAKRLHDSTVRMLGYNGSIPGPTLHVQQGSEVIVNVTNDGDLDTTVHWHGLRLENKYDGVPHETQQPIPIGGAFTYRIQFPDPGLYWYHPHIREDYTQEMGLYGNIVIEPSEPRYWPAANRDVVLTLDDVLLEDGKIAAFSVAETTYTAMGRYGNLLLIGGQTDLTVTGRAGEVLRLWLTNTANTRVFNVRLPGARMKLIGGDSGRVEREEFVSEVLLAPSERVVVDVLLDQPGELTLEHQTPNRTYPLASITVAEEPAEPSLADQFRQLRTAPELAAERRQLDHWLAAAPDKILALVAEMDDPTAHQPGTGPTVYACPMHPDVTSDQSGRCPQCGMRLLAASRPAAPVTYACPMHPEVTSDQPGRCPQCGMKLLATATATVSYACPMHPEVTSDQPGRCPQCGMRLLAASRPAAPVTYACPMHPEVTSDQPGRCPECGMKLLATATATATVTVSYACPMHPEVTSDQPGRCPQCGMKLLAAGPVAHTAGDDMAHTPAGAAHHQHGHGGEEHAMEHHGMEHEGMEHHGTDEDPSGARGEEHSAHSASSTGHEHGSATGIEWEDDMVAINRVTTTANMHWRFVDRTAGAAAAAIDWRFTVGDRVKIRLVNEMDSDHPMHHPFHLHGAGRFLVLARDGVPEPNLVWKDTVLVRTGQTVDILFDVTNPGLWMAHCHIAEHMQSGMMFSFTVDRGAAR